MAAKVGSFSKAKEDYTCIASCFNLSKLFIPEPGTDNITNRLVDLSRLPLQCVRSIEPERGSGGHFHTFAVFLSTPTSTRCHCLLECGKGL